MQSLAYCSQKQFNHIIAYVIADRTEGLEKRDSVFHSPSPLDGQTGCLFLFIKVKELTSLTPSTILIISANRHALWQREGL